MKYQPFKEIVMLYGYDWFYGPIWPEFIVVRGCVLRKRGFSAQTLDGWIRTHKNSCQSIESVVNHVHIYDVLVNPADREIPESVYVDFGKFLKKTWRRAASIQVPDRRLYIEMEHGPSTYGPEVRAYQTEDQPVAHTAPVSEEETVHKYSEEMNKKLQTAYDHVELSLVLWPNFRVINDHVLREWNSESSDIGLGGDHQPRRDIELVRNLVDIRKLLEPLPSETPVAVYWDFAEFLKESWKRALASQVPDRTIEVVVREGDDEKSPEITAYQI